MCCDSWGHKESDMTERLNKTSWQESNDKPRQCTEKQRHYSAGQGLYSQDYGLSSGHVQL